MALLSNLKALALHCLLPQTCCHCREDLAPRWDKPLCPYCLKGLVPAEPPFCLRCAEPLNNNQSLCPACAGRPFACRTIRAAFLYKGPVPALAHGFKYRGRQDAARTAGRWMAEHLPRFRELSGYDALVPVPLHPRRLCERGYNQAEILAREIGLRAGLPVKDLLERPKATKPQWDLDREARRDNLAGAFTAKPQARGLSVLIIDDICTSGNSLEECGRALHRAGALRIAAFVFARQTLAA